MTSRRSARPTLRSEEMKSGESGQRGEVTVAGEQGGPAVQRLGGNQGSGVERVMPFRAAALAR